MTRGQRAAHVRIWIALALIVSALFAAALIARERVREAVETARALAARAP